MIDPQAAHPWVAAGQHGARFGIVYNLTADWPRSRDFAQTVEGLGFDSLWLADHPLVAGHGLWPPLAALAEVTRTIRLGTLVSCAAYRHPAVLAREAADVDRISGGRLVLGLGSGDMPAEFDGLGIDYPAVKARQTALEEALRITRPLLRGEAVSFQGDTFRVNGAVLQPPAIQQPHVPILVAGGGERTTLRFVAQHADACNLGAAAWAGHAYSPEDANRKLAVLARHCEEVGRPTKAILRTALLTTILAESSTAAQEKLALIPAQRLAFMERLVVAGTPDDAVSRVRTLLEVGFQYVMFFLPTADWESMELLAQRVIPCLARTDSGSLGGTLDKPPPSGGLARE
jgi:alkanesulfonate monooxygenase SsuD/methylene tetrahydromethanopterin reductase-like flavin-dependent oxidoreductase (luciferase family)